MEILYNHNMNRSIRVFNGKYCVFACNEFYNRPHTIMNVQILTINKIIHIFDNYNNRRITREIADVSNIKLLIGNEINWKNKEKVYLVKKNMVKQNIEYWFGMSYETYKHINEYFFNVI
jgi:hypothetical protein